MRNRIRFRTMVIIGAHVIVNVRDSSMVIVRKKLAQGLGKRLV